VGPQLLLQAWVHECERVLADGLADSGGPALTTTGAEDGQGTSRTTASSSGRPGGAAHAGSSSTAAAQQQAPSSQPQQPTTTLPLPPRSWFHAQLERLLRAAFPEHVSAVLHEADATALFAPAALLPHAARHSLAAAAVVDPPSSLRAADAGELGAGAETVYRDKHGRKLDYLTEMMKGQEGKGSKESNAPAWGGGLKQQQLDDEQRAYMRREAAKPFARYADDADLDEHMRHTERWGDPLVGRTGGDKARAAAAALRPKYRGPAPPPNRFGIQPGHRWDGVDRSNGFEKDFFKMQANASLRKQAAHMWSTEDM
jgi:hypothetical protein